MLERFFSIGLALLLLTGAGQACAYINTPTLQTTAPVAGQTVTVFIESGVCDAMLDYGAPGLTDITRVGNDITILIDSLHSSEGPFCNYPTTTLDYPVGAFEQGAYSLRVDRRYQPLFGPAVVETLTAINFTVGARASDTPIPVFGPVALSILVLCVLLIVRRKHAAVVLIGLMVCLPFGHQAVVAQTQEIQVLMSSDPGAPTADDIVNYFRTTPRAVHVPESFDLYLPPRAMTAECG